MRVRDPVHQSRIFTGKTDITFLGGRTDILQDSVLKIDVLTLGYNPEITVKFMVIDK